MVMVVMEKRNSILDSLLFCLSLCFKIGQNTVIFIFSKPNAASQAQPKHGKSDAEWQELPSASDCASIGVAMFV